MDEIAYSEEQIYGLLNRPFQSSDFVHQFLIVNAEQSSDLTNSSDVIAQQEHFDEVFSRPRIIPPEDHNITYGDLEVPNGPYVDLDDLVQDTEANGVVGTNLRPNNANAESDSSTSNSGGSEEGQCPITSTSNIGVSPEPTNVNNDWGISRTESIESVVTNVFPATIVIPVKDYLEMQTTMNNLKETVALHEEKLKDMTKTIVDLRSKLNPEKRSKKKFKKGNGYIKWPNMLKVKIKQDSNTVRVENLHSVGSKLYYKDLTQSCEYKKFFEAHKEATYEKYRHLVNNILKPRAKLGKGAALNVSEDKPPEVVR